MAQSDSHVETLFLGDQPPLRENGRRLPDKRRVSVRWLSGAVLAAIVSVVLMGGALFAALEGREILAASGAFREDVIESPAGSAPVKGDRPGVVVEVDNATSNVMMVSTITREGDRDVVKVKPFLKVATPLAVPFKRDAEYPPFDPLAVFADTGKAEEVEIDEQTQTETSGQIYGARVESEVSIKMADFDPKSSEVAQRPAQRDSDIEELVRNAAPGLDAGGTSTASLAYFDPSRFSFQDSGFISSPGVTITEENVSLILRRAPEELTGPRYEERVIRVRSQASIAKILEAEGFKKADAETFEKGLSADLGATDFLPDDRIRVAFERQPGDPEGSIERPTRVSIYRGDKHLVSIAKSDSGQFVYASEPVLLPQAMASSGGPQLLSPSARLPSNYDAIYRAALAEGLGPVLAAKLIRIFAFDVDYNSSISISDELSFFVSLEEGKEKPTERSEILFASIKSGSVERRYYRFRDPTNNDVDYYDEKGKSAKKFLLRQPVPNGKFRSPFGYRRHPILGYRKMHWGVDWAAPRGTPIIAAGNGIVESAGWESGYGKQTVIRHANGYVTSYSHQSKIPEAIKPGARVRQGQIIGFVGSTGLSTGPHLHYEVVVNGTKVDPMRIRLPKGRELKGKELSAFTAERDRLDALLIEEEGSETPQIAQY